MDFSLVTLTDVNGALPLPSASFFLSIHHHTTICHYMTCLCNILDFTYIYMSTQCFISFICGVSCGLYVWLCNVLHLKLINE